jgi:hypothetical protein
MNEEELRKDYLGNFLEKMAELLDITPTQHADAVAKYEAVTNYLKEDENISRHSVEMFPQGSFSLGTVTKPDSEDDEIDVDLVCELKNGTHEIFTQSALKKLIGDRLKSGRYKDMLTMPDGRRCWRINYAEDTQFHMDILPAIPDSQTINTFMHLPDYYSTAISITDKDHENYERFHEGWPKSNPRGYLKWFKNQMLVQLNESKRLFSSKHSVKIDEVPDYKVKTPLQRAIQILKRHRNMMWCDNPSLKHDDKPISIIITTLAAKAYGNEDNLFDALSKILDGMPKFIERRSVGGKAVTWVENPVDHRENFADKWEAFPIREENFFLWLREAKSFFNKLLAAQGRESLNESLEKGLGDKITKRTFSAMSNDTRISREANQMGTIPAAGGVLSERSEKKIPNHKFYGGQK